MSPSASRTYPLRDAAIIALLGLALAYHGVMLHALLAHEPGRRMPIDRLHPVVGGRDTFAEDFYSYYQSGRNFLDGRSMYRLEGSTLVVPRPGITPSPPLTGMLFALVNLALPAAKARVVLIILYELQLIGIVALLSWHMRLGRSEACLASLMVLGFTPLYPEHYVGQLNIFLAFLLTLILVAEERGRTSVSAISWTISLCLKPALLVLAALDLRRLRLVRLAVVSSIVALPTLAYFLAYPGTFRMFVDHYFGGIAQNTPGALGFYSFVLDAGLRAGIPVERWLPVARRLVLAIPVVAVGVLLLDRRPDPSLWICILVLAYCLSVQHFWEYSYVLAAPVCCFLFFRHRMKLALWTWALLAIPTPFAPWRAMDVDYVRPYAAAVRGFRWDVLVMGALHHLSKAGPLLALWGALIGQRLLTRVRSR